MLEIKNLERKSGKFVLSGINFSVEEGYLVAVLGPNGAGKSTLFQTIMRPHKKDGGTILWNGRDIRKEREWFLQQTAFLSEDLVFADQMTAMENAKMFGIFYKDFEEQLFATHMKKMGVSPNLKVGAMSRGQLLRFQLAFARARCAKLYLMDEPTAGMDPAFRMEFYQILREILMEEATILMATHIQADVDRNCDYVLRLQEGRQISYEENLGEERDYAEAIVGADERI